MDKARFAVVALISTLLCGRYIYAIDIYTMLKSHVVNVSNDVSKVSIS